MKKTDWMKHVEKEREKKKNKGKPLSDILKLASKTYKKK
jgi:hypothetical protein